VKIYAISDNQNILTGLGLAEVSGKLAHTPQELLKTLEQIAPEASLVIISSDIAQKSADILEEYRAKNPLPLITTIPSP